MVKFEEFENVIIEEDDIEEGCGKLIIDEDAIREDCINSAIDRRPFEEHGFIEGNDTIEYEDKGLDMSIEDRELLTIKEEFSSYIEKIEALFNDAVNRSINKTRYSVTNQRCDTLYSVAEPSCYNEDVTFLSGQNGGFYLKEKRKRNVENKENEQDLKKVVNGNLFDCRDDNNYERTRKEAELRNINLVVSLPRKYYDNLCSSSLSVPDTCEPTKACIKSALLLPSIEANSARVETDAVKDELVKLKDREDFDDESIDLYSDIFSVDDMTATESTTTDERPSSRKSTDNSFDLYTEMLTDEMVVCTNLKSDCTRSQVEETSPGTCCENSFDLYSDLLGEKRAAGEKAELNENVFPRQTDDSSSFDLYSDMLSEELTVKKMHVDELARECESFRNETLQLRENVQAITQQNIALKKNISALFKTAKLEIQRKEQEITTLRSRLDSIIFRRSRSFRVPQSHSSTIADDGGTMLSDVRVKKRVNVVAPISVCDIKRQCTSQAFIAAEGNLASDINTQHTNFNSCKLSHDSQNGNVKENSIVGLSPKKLATREKGLNPKNSSCLRVSRKLSPLKERNCNFF